MEHYLNKTKIIQAADMLKYFSNKMEDHNDTAWEAAFKIDGESNAKSVELFTAFIKEMEYIERTAHNLILTAKAVIGEIKYDEE